MTFSFLFAPGQGCALASVMLQARAVHDDPFFSFFLLQARAVHLHLLCSRPGLCMMTFFFFAPGQGCAFAFVMLQARAVHDDLFFWRCYTKKRVQKPSSGTHWKIFED